MEVFNLNIIPGAVAPIIHASQYDEDREFRANLFEGDQVFELTGEETISVNVRKTDGNVVTAAVVNTGANYVEFSTTEQMTACAGANLCQLRIENSPRKIGTLNFILAVERDPLEGGIQSESEINNLATQVAEMVAEEVATQYDSGNVIFDNEPTDNHGIGYTVTSEGIKTAIDNAFDYDNTASGSIVHITDGADNIPVKSLSSQIVAVESGSGTKSPTNPYTISGFDSGVVTRLGKNLLENKATSGTIGTITFTVNADKSITVNGSTTTQRVFLVHTNFSFNADLILSGIPSGSGLLLNVAGLGSDTGNGFTFNGSTPRNIQIVVPANSTINNVTVYPMVRLASGVDDTYEAYNGNDYTFAFGQTVFGGYFDNKGNLVVTHGSYTFDGTETPIAYGSGYRYVVLSGKEAKSYGQAETPTLICNEYNAITRQQIQNGTTGISITSDTILLSTNTPSGVQVVYELANPITLAITSQDIPTLLGENNIFSNCGDVEVNYYTNKANDILEFVDSEIGKKNGTNIPIEANSQDSIKDYVDDEISSTKDYVDGVVESGTNENGYYIKYKDGSMICTKTTEFSIATSEWQAWGNCYETALKDCGVWAMNFISSPVVSATQTGGAGWLEYFFDTDNTNVGKTRFVRPTVPSSTTIFKMNIIGIGRWKA